MNYILHHIAYQMAYTPIRPKKRVQNKTMHQETQDSETIHDTNQDKWSKWLLAALILCVLVLITGFRLSIPRKTTPAPQANQSTAYTDQQKGTLEIDATTAGAWGDWFAILGACSSLVGACITYFLLYTQWHEIERNKRYRISDKFESRFFQMLATLKDLRESLKYTSTEKYNGKNEHSGALALEAILKDNITTLKNNLQQFSTETNHCIIKDEELKFVAFQLNHPDALRQQITIQKNTNESIGHYLRFLYLTLKYVDKGNIDNETKSSYAHIVRAILTEHEIGIIMFSCITHYGERMRPLINRYNMLKHLTPELVESARLQYEPEAFSEDIKYNK